MIKNIIKTLGIGLLVSSVLFSVQFKSNAASQKNSDVTTGRTQQEIKTGLIKYDQITNIPHYASTVKVSGTVTIDGPKLVLKVNGLDVTTASTIEKVADKTWTYSYTAPLNGKVGDVSFNIEAYTIYQNGKPSMDIHTSATPVTETVHVPFVSSFETANLSWEPYDRVTNTFTLSYNLVKVWDDGNREVAAEKSTTSVNGTASYEIMASDITHNNGVLTSVATVTPPTVIRDFTLSSQTPSWTYNASNKTYSLSFIVDTLWSNDSKGTEVLVFHGLTPDMENEVSVTIEKFTKNMIFKAPATPAAPAPAKLDVLSTIVVVTGKETVANNSNENNYKVYYYVKVRLSNNEEYISNNLDITIPNNSGNNSLSKSVNKTFTIGDVDYSVNYNVATTK